MAKRLREFKRFALTAKTGELLRSCLVDKTFNDHFSVGKCEAADALGPCIHERSGTLAVARLIEAGIKIGTKRATLDIPDPYCGGGDPAKQVKVLKQVAERMRAFAKSQKRQQQKAFTRLADEIDTYADRSPLVVLAEIAAEDE